MAAEKMERAPPRTGVLMRLLRNLPALLGVGLLCGAVYVVQHEFRTLKFADIKQAVEGIPTRALVIAFIFNLLAYGILTLYDRLGTIYAGHKVSYRRVAFASFCAYTLSHNLGFPAVSGAAVRYRLYAVWGLAPVQIAKVVAFCSLTFGLGALVLGGAILLFEPDAIPFIGDRLPLWAVYLVGAAMWVLVAAYVALAGLVGTVKLFGRSAELPRWRMAVAQVALAAIDVAVTAAIFYALLPEASGLTYQRFLAIYLASYSAGLAANLPGGIGVFDGAMLLGIADFVAAPQVIGAIVVFRLFYYIIPLFLAGSLFTGNEVLLRGGDLLRSRRLARFARASAAFSEPDFAIGAATGVVVMCGVLLLILAAIAPQPDFSWIDPDFGDVASGAGAFVPSLIGAGLLVLAAGLSQRVRLAWGSTIALLAAGAGYALVDGDALWLPIILVLSALLIAPFRGAFYRRARLFSGPLTADSLVPLLVLVIAAGTLLGFNRAVFGLTDGTWWEAILSPDLPNGQRAIIAVAVVVAALAIWRMIRPGHVAVLAWDEAARAKYASCGVNPPARADGVVMGEAARAGLAFLRLDGILLGLGDPVGTAADRPSAIWRLRDLAEQEGRHLAIWRAGDGMLKIHSDLGLTCLPLDAGGLPQTSLVEGPPPGGYLCCIAGRDLQRLPALLARANLVADPVPGQTAP